MKIRHILSLLLFSVISANAKIPYKDLKNADEKRVTLSQQAYLQGEYMKCIEYADSIHDDFIGGSEKNCRANALVHAYAAAACYRLSQYKQIDYASYGALYAENSSYDFLKKGTSQYLGCSYYFKNVLIKKKITTSTDINDFIRLAQEIDLAMTANSIAQEFWKANAFYDKSAKRILRDVEREYRQFYNYFIKYILPNKHIIKDNIALYYGLYTSEIILSMKDKKTRKKSTDIINAYLKDLSNTISIVGNPQNNKIVYIDLRNNLWRLSQIICVLANEKEIEWESATEFYINYLNFCEYVKGLQNNFELTSYDEIKSSLQMGEYLLVFYEAPITSGMLYHVSQHNMKHFYAFVIGWDKNEITILTRKLNTTISKENFETWQSWWPGMETLYILPTDYMRTLDYAGINQNMHMIMSVKSILKRGSSKVVPYKIKILANLKYSKYDNLNEEDDGHKTKGIGFYPLPYTKSEVVFLQNKLSDANLEILEGEDGTRSALFHKGEENVLHISTHGDMDQNLLDRLNKVEPYDGYTGDNVLKSCYLALSMYNDIDHPMIQLGSQFKTYDETYISGYDIKGHYLGHLNLVFLDACKTAYAKNVNGDTFSLAEAFKIAGVKNVIAYLEPVRDDVAAEFAKIFYTNLFSGMNIHDSFYDAKRIIYSYHPNLKVVLWE